MNDRVAVITGASRGLGAAVARAFSEAGAKVGLLSRSGDDLGLPDALGVPCDVRNRGAVFSAVAEVVECFGSLDCAVANAGVGTYGPFLEMDGAAIDEMIDVNLRGHDPPRPRRVAASDRGRRRRLRVGRVGRRAAGLPRRGRLQRVEVRPARVHARARPRAARAGRALHGVCPGGIATDFAIGHGRPEEALEGMMSAEEAAEAVVVLRDAAARATGC